MEPVTHFLTGACLGRSGFNRKTAYATLAMTLAAEAPDMDVIAGFGGPVSGFCHHRGITHTLLGAPFMALAVTGVVWVVAKALRKMGCKPPLQPVRWRWIWLLCLIADLSHLLLDYTNNYGLRPFFPFDAHWYAWSIVFIFEPTLFAALVLGLVLPALFGLVEGEMRRRPRGELQGRGWAIVALTFAGLLYGLRGAEHARAIELVRAAPGSGGQPLFRVAAEPVMIDPFTWHTLAETRDSYQTATVHTLRGRSDPADAVDPEGAVPKPLVTPAVALAKASYLGRVYGSWASWPVTEDLGSVAPPGDGQPLPPGAHTVLFRDLRFAPAALGELAGSLQGPAQAPALAGYVVVGFAGDAQGEILSQWMSGRAQH